MNTAPRVTLRKARMRHSGGGVPSPCVAVCRLDEISGRCVGCHRTLAEIGNWSRMSDDEKLAAWAAIEARQPLPDTP